LAIGFSGLENGFSIVEKSSQQLPKAFQRLAKGFSIGAKPFYGGAIETLLAIPSDRNFIRTDCLIVKIFPLYNRQTQKATNAFQGVAGNFYMSVKVYAKG
jgi:hypothetical protein